MSDWSYRYRKPRAEVHEARYGTTEVPQRRGAGGLTTSTSGAATALIALGAGLALIGLSLRR